MEYECRMTEVIGLVQWCCRPKEIAIMETTLATWQIASSMEGYSPYIQLPKFYESSTFIRMNISHYCSSVLYPLLSEWKFMWCYRCSNLLTNVVALAPQKWQLVSRSGQASGYVYGALYNRYKLVQLCKFLRPGILKYVVVALTNVALWKSHLLKSTVVEFCRDGCCAGFCDGSFLWFRPFAGMAMGRDFYYIWTTDVNARLADLFRHVLEQFVGTAVASTLQC